MSSPIIRRIFLDLAFDRNSKRPLYLQIADHVVSLIKSGELKFKQKILGSRELGELLLINRVTITKAYAELESQGWIESHKGRGTFVAAQLADSDPEKMGILMPQIRRGLNLYPRKYLDTFTESPYPELHLDDGYPDISLAPLKEFYRAYRSQLTRVSNHQKFGSYGNPAGPLAYRQALSTYLNETRSLKTNFQQIMSVRGTLMGINLVCNALINPGDVVVSELPGWRSAEQNFIHAGARIIGVGVDEHGMIVEELREICKKHRVRMVYVTPHHQFPTTVSLRMDRRIELLRLASEHRFLIFEDDYDFDFHYKLRPLLPLASADENGMVIYCGSFSKSFSPAFRMGYLMASEKIIQQLCSVRMIVDRQGDHLLDNAVAELLSDGTIQRNLRKTLSVYRTRRDVFCTLLSAELGNAVEFSIPEGGMSVWTRFSPSIDLDKLGIEALKKGLHLPPKKEHIYENFDQNALRLGFASSSPLALEKCIDIIKKLL